MENHPKIGYGCAPGIGAMQLSAAIGVALRLFPRALSDSFDTHLKTVLFSCAGIGGAPLSSTLEGALLKSS